MKFLALESIESLAYQQINSFFHIHLNLSRTSFSNQQINTKKIHLLKFFALESLESLANQQINSFLHIHLTLSRTSFSNQQINTKKIHLLKKLESLAKGPVSSVRDLE